MTSFQEKSETDAQEFARLPVQEGGTSLRPAPDERTVHRRDGQEGQQPVRGYYDIPMLKPPVWTWEIATYFFFGGLSGGAYLISRMADRFGGEKYQAVVQAGTAVSALALLPCPPLLIADLGDRKRFHYMLRVFKPKSPMNLGAWVLTAFGGVLALTVLSQWQKARHASRNEISMSARWMEGALDFVSDAAGIPLALGLAGYTGVLLSTTNTPIWARNLWLGPLFSAGAISTGTSAIQLALATQSPSLRSRRVEKSLHQLDSAAKAAEVVTLGGFLASAGQFAQPVTRGKYAPALWGGTVGSGLALSSLLAALPVRSEKTRRWLQIAASVAGLAGGFALRWAITQAGHASAKDPDAARDASRPESRKAGSP